MATATPVTETITSTTGYTLELTPEEAQTLRDVIGWSVGGYGPRRDHINSIWDALNDAGLHSSNPVGITGMVEVQG